MGYLFHFFLFIFFFTDFSFISRVNYFKIGVQYSLHFLLISSLLYSLLGTSYLQNLYRKLCPKYGFPFIFYHWFLVSITITITFLISSLPYSLLVSSKLHNLYRKLSTKYGFNFFSITSFLYQHITITITFSYFFSSFFSSCTFKTTELKINKEIYIY